MGGRKKNPYPSSPAARPTRSASRHPGFTLRFLNHVPPLLRHQRQKLPSCFHCSMTCSHTHTHTLNHARTRTHYLILSATTPTPVPLNPFLLLLLSFPLCLSLSLKGSPLLFLLFLPPFPGPPPPLYLPSPCRPLRRMQQYARMWSDAYGQNLKAPVCFDAARLGWGRGRSRGCGNKLKKKKNGRDVNQRG